MKFTRPQTPNLRTNIPTPFDDTRRSAERRKYQDIMDTLEDKASDLEERARQIRKVRAAYIEPEYDLHCKTFPNVKELEEIVEDAQGTLVPTQDDAPHTPDLPRGSHE